MARRKMTPFARFFIVMLIIVPLAYFGASWYNGEDPLNIKQQLGLEQNTEVAQPAKPAQRDAATATVESLEQRISKLEKELQQCKKDLQELKAKNSNR
jgi:cell division protein FtsB